MIDTTEETRTWLERLDPTAALPYFAAGNNTRSSALRAAAVAKRVMEGVRELDVPFAARLVPPVQTPGYERTRGARRRPEPAALHINHTRCALSGLPLDEQQLQTQPAPARLH